MILAQAERRLAIAEKLAAVIADPRDPLRLVHRLPQILRARILAIACGYEDTNDLDRLRFDPAFKLACGRLPDSGLDLCSQPTMSRWENAPNLREVIRLVGVMIDLYFASYATPPVAIACGYEDASDLDRLRFDPAFKLACRRLPDSGLDLCAQPTMSRSCFGPGAV